MRNQCLGKRARPIGTFAARSVPERVPADRLVVAEETSDPPPGRKRRGLASSRETPKQAAFVIHDDGHQADASAGPASLVSRSFDNASRVQRDSRPLSPPYEDHDISAETPRKRKTPSLFTTPRHRVSVGGAALTPRTPRTPLSALKGSPASKSIFAEGRRVFSRGFADGCIVGRESERARIETFLSTALNATSSGFLYVSGPPGTGKSALVEDVCHTQQFALNCKVVHLNCMSVKSAVDVFAHLASKLDLSDDVFGASARDVVAKGVMRASGSEPFLVILDEIDQLLDLDLPSLHSLFEWSLDPASRLVLIGIANALDLTDRLLPQIRARNIKPDLLAFLPYEASDIAKIITHRAKALLAQEASAAPADFIPLLTTQAITFISKKVAAQNGDLRKAFDLASNTIGLLETEERQSALKASSSPPSENVTRSPLAENPNLSSPKSPYGDQKTRAEFGKSRVLAAETAPRASLSHALRVSNSAFTVNSTGARLKALNLQQKAAMCAMAVLESRQRRTATAAAQEIDPREAPATQRRPKSKGQDTSIKTPGKTGGCHAPNVRQVYDTYGTLCRRDDALHALSFSEFRDVISNLETTGLVSAVDGRGSLSALAASATPSRKGRGGAGAGMSSRAEDRRIKAEASISELDGALDGGPGCQVLKQMLQGAEA